jgi:alpha-2-macroglobulin
MPRAAQLEAIRRHVNNRVVETAGAANFTTGYDDQTYLLLSSDRRTDAILLDALIEDNPQQRPDPQAGQRPAGAPHQSGRWGNTQENVFVLLALDRYFNTYEARRPTSSPASGWATPTPGATSLPAGAPPTAPETLSPCSLPGARRNPGGG